MDAEQAMPHVDEIVGRINANPSYREILFKTLSAVRRESQKEALVEIIESFPEMRNSIRVPQTYLSMLVDMQALAYDGGEPSEDRETTEATGLPEGGSAPNSYILTEAGEAALEAMMPAKRLDALFDARPNYVPVFLDMLAFCEAPTQLSALNERYTDHPLLQTPRIFPSTLIAWLEGAGGLEFNDGWVSTPAGKEQIRNN